jgi:3-mercaptopyruvate sulfurtransferase SseA
MGAFQQQVNVAHPIVVYCDGGDCEASHDMAIMLESAGYMEVYVLHDGYPGWERAGHPVEQGPPAGGGAE